MPTITVPEETYARLARHAARLGTTPDALALPALERAAAEPDANGRATPTPVEPPLPLTGEAWLRAFEALNRDIQARADRYPPGHVLDVSREAMYADREDSQL